ncbi:hypothetical protein EN994_17865, partial [Mesorhizobium sp. M7A.F.Ca.CA.002.09.1.1]
IEGRRRAKPCRWTGPCAKLFLRPGRSGQREIYCWIAQFPRQSAVRFSRGNRYPLFLELLKAAFRTAPW